MLARARDLGDAEGLSSKYTLTLSTTAEAGRPATATTTWTLTRDDAAIARGGCPGDPHGDHARLEGRAAAKNNALSAGLRITDRDVKVVYAARPAPAPTPTAPTAPAPTAPAPAPTTPTV